MEMMPFFHSSTSGFFVFGWYQPRIARRVCLDRFHKIHGHVNVPQHWRGSPKLGETKRKAQLQGAWDHWDNELGVWVWRLRRLFRTGALLEKQQSLLEEIGFVWNWKDHVWESFFRELLFFKMHLGHCLVSKTLGFVWNVLSEPLLRNNSIWRIFKGKSKRLSQKLC
ncbi:hypothetical protein GUITHDRAFT_146363 [Guillardia theta CCMP2712]|uniref:Helicase-associated domain-containing protein n=1 Tax=Guillardia theta (strain CCMP2712) TaxID=905079 RepID=L1IHP6_GUITC|nr:hypothetical protein GUITHDRAFT_146363 [Guillardia theta CCMP2712]EKX35627.1 hypothetical protein GUITHDRAFT_146363 [Guillardia theta CCMP2712]|eukprot:XP_005822607.1 hypothetical protein GUITHDRAFT_146363 [Guillardia theta CCMP2712]